MLSISRIISLYFMITSPFIYSISVFQSGFAPAAKAIKELDTRFHRLSTHAHPNKSGIIFAAFIWLYRDITKAICNPLRPCFIAYKRLHRIGGYKITACAAVLFPSVYHVLRPPFQNGHRKTNRFYFSILPQYQTYGKTPV